MVFTAKGKALTRSQDERMHQAWHIGAFGRIDKYPDLASVLSSASQREQSQDEIQRLVKAWLGGPPSETEH